MIKNKPKKEEWKKILQEGIAVLGAGITYYFPVYF